MSEPQKPLPPLALALMPPLFVVIWATGFVVARAVVPHADPMTFLTVRHLGVILVLGALALATRAPWPSPRIAGAQALIGVLLHSGYLGGVFWSVAHGMPAGMAALLAGLQPVVTALLAGPVLKERVTARQWLGIALGFFGAALVLWPKLGIGGNAIPPAAIAAACFAVAAMTTGTLLQKGTGGADLRTGSLVQYLAGVVPVGALALATEPLRFDMAPELLLALAWAVLGLSVGAISLLYILLRRGAVAGVSALFFLVPPVAALMAWGLFGETMNLVQIAGFGFATAGVWLASRP